ncbi:Polyisoprenoid-binding protein YceI [Loktanella fryxellensis]|uniref:Polyisoprenoid-binding protein YceI n=1 Tax=Loktanella fryxellensis TaxID=245187 RepID=A0A1H8F5S3_9RHOB|nr:YceI family protein [Loktanella fryxellensis]SEN27059.1 Polyisoprenoid-binding protein YceI [Loktanella fryxellensis]
MRLPLLIALLCATQLSAQDALPPAQTFALDPSHTSLTFSVNHIGMSNYTAGFDTLEGTLQLDPADQASAQLSVTVNVASLDLPTPPLGFREELLGPNFFDADQFPQISYVSTGVTPTGDTTADISGDLTLHGMTQPVILQATFNGNSLAGQFEPHARIGFSATGAFSRTAFGMGYGVPAEGSTMGVGDLVTVRIETEWTGDQTVEAAPVEQ